MNTLRVVLLIGLFMSITFGYGQQRLPQSQPPFNPVAGVDEIMKSIVDPLAWTVFRSVGTIMTEQRIEEIAPKNDGEWEAVRSAAMGLAEGGNLLMFESRTSDKEPDWITMSQQLIRRSLDAAEAAKTKDAEKLLIVGGDVYEVCESCHLLYMKFETWQRWRWKR
jgi:hypothetical protein